MQGFPMMIDRFRCVCFAVVSALLVPVALWTAGPAIAQDGGGHGGTVPGGTLGGASDAEMWRLLRQGGAGTVSLPDADGGTLIQSEGQIWRLVHMEQVPSFGGLGLVAITVLLCLFFALRGRIRISKGRSHRRITRFAAYERAAHWTLASSFILLALTGLNTLYGRHLLIPLMGRDAFAAVASASKYIHNFVAFAFMAALAVIFVIWVRHNILNRVDLVWLLKGGGLFSNAHPPAHKFNAGQKILFWLVMLLGVSISLSGWTLIFPFTTHHFAETFALFNAVLGTSFPTELTGLQEQQLAQVWHAIIAILFVMVTAGHIYIGSVGMEGAFDAMGSGQVDVNWARDHHSLWVEQQEAEMRAEKPASPPADPDASGQPAE